MIGWKEDVNNNKKIKLHALSTNWHTFADDVNLLFYNGSQLSKQKDYNSQLIFGSNTENWHRSFSKRFASWHNKEGKPLQQAAHDRTPPS